eukprot:1045035-Amphidinium_carterae.3
MHWITTTFPKQIFVGEHAGDLREEVASNGYGSQLVSKEAVQGYFNKDRARAMTVQFTADEMLAVLCYTGTDAYVALRSCMRKGECSKWPRFQYHLRNAVWKLANFDNHAPSVTELSTGSVQGFDVGLFTYPTFISTSWDFNIAERFAFGLDMVKVQSKATSIVTGAIQLSSKKKVIRKYTAALLAGLRSSNRVASLIRASFRAKVHNG